MTDTLTPIRLDEPSKPPRRNRGPLLAIAFAAIVLVVVGVAGFALTRDEGTPPVTSEATPTVASTTTAPTTTLAPGALPADTPALEVVQAWNARWAAGDVEGFEALVDPGASYFADNAGTAVARGSWYRIATGATVESTCSSITAQRIRCETTSISGLTPGEVLLDRSITVYTVADGRIQNFEFPDGYAPYYAYDIEGLERYRVWLRENDPAAFEELFALGETIVLETEEVRAAHQEQIARFLASARTLPADTPIVDVVAAYFERWDAGDVAGYEALVDAEASLFTELGVAEGVAAASHYQLVTGVVAERDCSQATATRVNCFTTYISGLAPGEVINEDFMVFVVEDGKIQTIEFPEGFTPLLQADSANRVRYREWLRSADPGRFRDVFGLDGLILLDTPEVRAAHQELVARYLAATR